MSRQVRVIIITGTMGAGKTTILSEASDILSSAGVVHAVIDLDTLGIAHLPADARELMFPVCRFLASMETAERRVRNREPGMLQAKLVSRVTELEQILNRANIEDFSIANDHGSVTKVA